MARRDMVDQWRDLPALAIGVRQICRRGVAGASGRCRPRPYARACGPADRLSAPTQAGDGTSQLIGFSMVSIFLRSLVYNVLFYALLVFWILVAIPTYLMPPRAFMAVGQAGGGRSGLLVAGVCNPQGGDCRGGESPP